MTDEPSLRIFRVQGRVQGVGFRHFVWKRALDLGVRGWVRNLSDGAVEVAAWGFEDQLEGLCLHLQQGPRWADVDEVVVEDSPVTEPPAGLFEIRI